MNSRLGDHPRSQYKVHKKLRIIGGDASGTWLWSPSDQRTRPMMEKVRAATFR